MNGYGIYSYGKNQLYMGRWVNGLRDGYGEIYGPKNNYLFGFFKNNLQNGFFMFYNTKSKKIIIGFNNNGRVDGILKYFRVQQEGKLIIIRNGRKIKEIDNQIKINNYLNDPNNIEQNNSFIDKRFYKYFFMKRNQLENILIERCNIEESEQINERLGKSNKKFNINKDIE